MEQHSGQERSTKCPGFKSAQPRPHSGALGQPCSLSLLFIIRGGGEGDNNNTGLPCTVDYCDCVCMCHASSTLGKGDINTKYSEDCPSQKVSTHLSTDVPAAGSYCLTWFWVFSAAEQHSQFSCAESSSVWPSQAPSCLLFSPDQLIPQISSAKAQPASLEAIFPPN